MRRWWLGAGALFAVSLALAVAPLERHYLYRGQGSRAGVLRSSDVTRHTLVAADGVAVRAFELPAPGRATTVVVFHNNRETADDQIGLARELRREGVGVVLAEYRGYGDSSDAAEPSEAGLYLDAEAVLAMLHARGVGPDRVVLFGVSLGTGVAAEMARRGHGRGLVLVAPYTSIPDLVDASSHVGRVSRALPDTFDTIAKCAEIRVPTLVVHGDHDEIVPFWMGEKVAGSIPRGTLLRVTAGAHGDLFARAGGEVYARTAAL